MVTAAISPDSTGTVLRGKVLMPDGSPAPFAVVNLISGKYWKRPDAIAISDHAGEFQHPLPQGSYWFYAKKGSAIARDFDKVTISASGGVSRESVIKLKQGFGRLIRSRSDRGCVVILDSRIVRKRYGETFLNSLPPARQVIGPSPHVYDAVEDFFAEMRSN